MRRFEREDLATLNGWRAVRGLPELERRDLPAFGLIVDRIGAGFLLRTESATAMLDGFVTSPAVPFRERYRALVQIARALVSVAQGHGCRTIGVVTKSTGIAKGLQRELKFVPLGSYQALRFGGDACQP